MGIAELLEKFIASGIDIKEIQAEIRLQEKTLKKNLDELRRQQKNNENQLNQLREEVKAFTSTAPPIYLNNFKRLNRIDGFLRRIVEDGENLLKMIET